MIFSIGQRFRHSFVISTDLQSDFMRIFKDRNPLHASDEFAQSKGFKGRVMHGNILNGFISYFIGECLPVKDVIIHSQNISFRSAVFVDETLAFEATILDVYESVQTVEFKFSFKNDAGTPVAVGKFQIGILK